RGDRPTDGHVAALLPAQGLRRGRSTGDGSHRRRIYRKNSEHPFGVASPHRKKRNVLHRIGDTYLKQKLLLVPHRIALAADEVGWTVRNDLIWSKLDPPPESPRNRWRSSHEHILFLSKQRGNYTFNADAIRVAYADATIKRWG